MEVSFLTNTGASINQRIPNPLDTTIHWQALDIWRNQPWKSFFQPRETGRYQLLGLLKHGVLGKRLPIPTMPPEFVDTVTQSHWQGNSWELGSVEILSHEQDDVCNR
mgnify:CR=1 FL=1